MKQKILLDCDPGIDDALAILLAFGIDALEILAITTVSGNRPVNQTFENARNIVALAGREDVPVHRGSHSPLDQTAPRSNLVHGDDGLGGIRLEPSQATRQETPSARKILDVLASEPADEVTLVAIGPLTNLALALAIDPETFRRARRLAIMGGAIAVPGNVTPAAEFNFWADPLAADRIVQSGVPIELFGLDVTTQAICTPQWLGAVAAVPGRIATALAAMVGEYLREDPLLHDTCPIAWLVAPQLFQSVPMCVRVDSTAGLSAGNSLGWGKERTDAPGPAQVHVHTGVDCSGLLDLMLTHLQCMTSNEAAT